jgi:hypothetical protein
LGTCPEQLYALIDALSIGFLPLCLQIGGERIVVHYFIFLTDLSRVNVNMRDLLFFLVISVKLCRLMKNI